jgi:hypothetical protein
MPGGDSLTERLSKTRLMADLRCERGQADKVTGGMMRKGQGMAGYGSRVLANCKRRSDRK